MPNFAPSKRKVKEMRTTKGNIAEKIIDKLLTSCQYESELILNFAQLKQETDDLHAREGIIRQMLTKVLKRWQRDRKIMPNFAPS